MDEAGIDMLLVGDSVAMVVHGHDTTLPVTMDEMLSHCKAVARGARRAFLVGDMPFGSGARGGRGGVGGVEVGGGGRLFCLEGRGAVLGTRVALAAAAPGPLC